MDGLIHEDTRIVIKIINRNRMSEYFEHKGVNVY